MLTELASYWPILLIVVALAIGAVLVLRRGQRVEIANVEATPQPTLARAKTTTNTGENDDTMPPDFLRIAPVAGTPQDLLRIKGLGPRIAMLLNGLGITRYEQIANLTDAEKLAVDAHLGQFKGRMAQDRWVEQARYLATDDIAGFEAEFGKVDPARFDMGRAEPQAAEGTGG